MEDDLVITVASILGAAAIYFAATFLSDRSQNLGLSRFARGRIRKLGKSAVAVVNRQRQSTSFGFDARVIRVDVQPPKGTSFSAEIGIPKANPLYDDLDDDDEEEDDDEELAQKKKATLPVLYVPGEPESVIIDYDELARRKELVKAEAALEKARRKEKKKRR